MKLLIAPINWGLGHAARCIPLVRKYMNDGYEIVLAGDGESLALLRRHFPHLRAIDFPALQLTYSKRNTQVWALAAALPRIILWSIRDHYALKRLLAAEHFDRVISDNRFGFYTSLRPKTRWIPRRRSVRRRLPRKPEPETIYITHQVMIKMPKGFRWLEPLVAAVHHRIILRYSQCWIPDYAGNDNLSGDLSHLTPLPRNAKFIGPLSRFPVASAARPSSSLAGPYAVVAVLSGLEPQRTMLERRIMDEYKSAACSVLIVQGLMHAPDAVVRQGNITLVPSLPDADLQKFLCDADTIIARSGYSTVMDLAALGCLGKARLLPTPGQTEQEYLARLLEEKRSALAD